MSFQLRRLLLKSPSQPSAELRLTNGLNVIAGASNTGKSLIVELIRYALGSTVLEKQVPEAEIYDRLALVIEHPEHNLYTIERALSGGDAIVLEGEVVAHLDPSKQPDAVDQLQVPQGNSDLGPPPPVGASDPKAEKTRILSTRSSASSEETLPGFLLNLCALPGKRIRDKQASTRNLSFRDLRELMLIDEQRIISTGSPIHSGERTERPAEEAIFSLLLTGIDDSAVVVAEKSAALREEHRDKAQKIAFLLEELRADIPEGVTIRSIRSQLKKLDASIERAQQSYKDGFSSVSSLESQRRKLIKERSESRARSDALRQLVERFGVLQKKYDSDLERLSAVGEASEQFALLASGDCPVCGNPLSIETAHHQAVEVHGSAFFQGIEAERAKIISLKRDLVDTIAVLSRDTSEYSQRAESVVDEIREVEERLNTRLKPQARELSERLGELLEKRAEVQEILNSLERIEKYKNLRTEELIAAKGLLDPPPVRNDTNAKNEFALVVEEILKSWKYPEAGRVFFDDKTQDLIINGKRRAALGKGYRAITASAFLVALMQYCQSKNLPHPGFVVLDTPVRTFKDRQHGSAEGDIVSDDVKDAFFTDLATRFSFGQVIIAENDSPPVEVKNRINYIWFSGNPEAPPAGFIPNAR